MGSSIPPTSLSVERARLMHWAYPPIHFIHLYLLGNKASSQTFYLLSRGYPGEGARTPMDRDGFRWIPMESAGKSQKVPSDIRPPPPRPPSPRAPNARQGEGFPQDSLKTSPRASKDHSNTPHGPSDTRPRPPKPVHEPFKTRPGAPKPLPL